MTVSLRDARHSPTERAWIARVYPEYLDELAVLTAATTGLFPVNGDYGLRTPELLVRWFRDERTHPLVILQGGQPVGFALVAWPLTATPTSQPSSYELAEFFIRRAYRRRGVGALAAALIFRRFAGDWRVQEAQRNQSAVAFWRRVIAEYTQGHYTERLVDGEVRHTFRTPERT